VNVSLSLVVAIRLSVSRRLTKPHTNWAGATYYMSDDGRCRLISPGREWEVTQNLTATKPRPAAYTSSLPKPVVGAR